MAHGFRARNGNNIVTIDHNYANMEFYSKGTVTPVPSGWTRWGYYSQSFVVSGATQGFLACCAPKFVKFFLLGQQVVSGGIQYTVVANSQQPIEWFAFAPPFSDAGGIGLRIRSTTGQVYFNSNRRYMRVLDVNAGSHMVPMNPSTGLSENPIDNGGYIRAYGGKKVAVIQGIFACEFRVDTFSEYEAFESTECLAYQCWMENGQTGTLKATWEFIGVDGPFDPNSIQHERVNQWHYSMMLVDVTGF